MRALRFLPQDREALVAIARAAMPAGRIFPAGGAAAVDRVDAFLAGAAPEVARAYSVMLHSLLAALRLKCGRPIAKLSDAELEAGLCALQDGDYARRSLLRLVTMPLKLAHYHDRALFEAVGCQFGQLVE